MKHRLEHYDVPAEFADLKTLGCRVFDDEEGQRVAQVWAVEKKMQFFMFPAERDVKTGDIVVIPAGCPHRFINSGDTLLRQIDIHASPKFVQANL